MSSKKDSDVAKAVANWQGKELLWSGDGVPDGHDLESWTRCIAAAGMYIRNISITKIAREVGRSRQTIHRWIRETPAAWEKAIELNKNDQLRAIEAKARVALDESLNAENEAVKSSTARWVLSRTDTNFLDPKLKTFQDPESGQVGLAELSGVSGEDLRKLLQFVRKGGDLEAAVKDIQANEGAIDITPDDEEAEDAPPSRKGKDLADSFFAND